MIYYRTSLYTYEEYVKENKTDRLSKFEKIKISKGAPKFSNITEIFDNDIDNLDYRIEEYDHTEYPNETNTVYYFESENKNRKLYTYLTQDNYFPQQI